MPRLHVYYQISLWPNNLRWVSLAQNIFTRRATSEAVSMIIQIAGPSLRSVASLCWTLLTTCNLSTVIHLHVSCIRYGSDLGNHLLKPIETDAILEDTFSENFLTLRFVRHLNFLCITKRTVLKNLGSLKIYAVDTN